MGARHLSIINSEKAYELVVGMQFRVPGRDGLEHYAFIIIDFEKGLAFFSRLPTGRNIPTSTLQEIALLPCLDSMRTYITHLD